MRTPPRQKVAESIERTGPNLTRTQRKQPTPIDLSIQTQKSRDQDKVAPLFRILSLRLEDLASQSV
jgi:hypothetical protein